MRPVLEWQLPQLPGNVDIEPTGYLMWHAILELQAIETKRAEEQARADKLLAESVGG